MGLHAFLLEGLRLTLQHLGDQALLHHNQGTPSPQFARPPEAPQRPNCKQRALRYLKDALGQHCYHRHSADLPKLPAFHQTQWQQRKLVLEGNGPGRHIHPKNKSLVAAILAIKHSLPNVAQVFKNGCISLVVLANRPAKYSLQRILWHSATRVSKSRAFPRKVMPGGHITS